MPAPGSTQWLLLIHRIPAKPDYLRVKVGRQLRRLGAVAIKNSVYVMPNAAEIRENVAGLAREILQSGGEAMVCEARLTEGLADGAIEDLLRRARESEYAVIAREARHLGALVRKVAASDALRRQRSRTLERLRARFDQIVAHDHHAARGRETAAGILSLIEDRLQGVDEGALRAREAQPPQGATWVTRTGVMVDRIASAWLIRRFIDSTARFKFVGARGYRARPEEIRFDMAGAEYTHRGGLCTFEVLVEHFRLQDSALQPIAEIVHDLDLEDGRHQRPEAAGVGRMIVGLAIAVRADEARLSQGGAVFDNLYESFRRSGR